MKFTCGTNSVAVGVGSGSGFFFGFRAKALKTSFSLFSSESLLFVEDAIFLELELRLLFLNKGEKNDRNFWLKRKKEEKGGKKMERKGEILSGPAAFAAL